MGSCVCTIESFAVDAPQLSEMECPVCLQRCRPLATWVCTWFKDCCGAQIHDEDWMGSIAKKRRELLKFDRKEMAAFTGYSPKTIKQYEWVKCSKAYFEKTEEIIRKNYKKAVPA